MGVFKNEVGRPSNRVINTRRMLMGSFVVLIVSAIVIGVNYTSNKKESQNLKGASLQLVESDTSGVYFASNELNTSNNAAVVKETYYMYGDVYNSKYKKAGYDRIINNDDASYLEKNLSKISNSKDSLVKKLADVNHDGRINKNDVRLIKRMSSNQRKIYGDLDGDKTITYKDKKLLYKYLNAKTILKSSQRKLADIDGNGRVNKTDYQLMIYKPAYVYCFSTAKTVNQAKKSCTWYQADKAIKLNNYTYYYLYRKDLSNDEVTSKGMHYTDDLVFEYEDHLKNYISEFNSDYFGITQRSGKGDFILEQYDGKTFKFRNYILDGRVSDVFYGYEVDNIFEFQLINVSNNKVIYDSLKGKEFSLTAGKTYNLKLKGTIKGENKNETFESKPVKIRLVSDGTYVKNSVIGKTSEVLFLLESFTKKSITLSKSVIYQKGSLIQLRGTIDTIVIPKGFDFSNLEPGSLDISEFYFEGNQRVKIINKTGKSAEWKVLVDSYYQLTNKNNMEECIFETGTCKYEGRPSFAVDKEIIVTNK